MPLHQCHELIIIYNKNKLYIMQHKSLKASISIAGGFLTHLVMGAVYRTICLFEND